MDKPTVIESPTDDIYEGEEVQLTCNVDANPSTTSLTWKESDGSIFNWNKNILKKELFNNMSYHCIAIQGEYEKQSDEINVKVKGK